MGARLHALSLLAAAALAAGCRPERPGLPPRHLLLVTVESLRADHCSFLAHAPRTTTVPSDELQRAEGRAFGLDDLAARGVVFSRCYAPSPVTAVSLATLHTGRTPLENGLAAADERLPGQNVTLAECLRAGGFRTAAFVSGDAPSDSSFGQGFEAFTAAADDSAALSAAAAWLGRDPGSGARRFAWVHLSSLLPPWTPDRDSPTARALLEDRVFGDPAYAGPVDGTLASLADVNAGRTTLGEADRAALDARYDRELAAFAATLWRGLSATYDFHTGLAEASETWPRTLLVVAGVQGVELGEHGGVGSAGTLHEAALRVPLVLRHPDSFTGERILDEVVELADVMPTLLDVFELPVPAGVRGRSLLARTDSYVERPFERRPAFAQLPERVFSVRTERWRLVWNPLRVAPPDRPTAAGPIPTAALYEPEVDPDGLHDVSAAHPEVVAELQAAIKAWREAQKSFPPEDKPPRRR